MSGAACATVRAFSAGSDDVRISMTEARVLSWDGEKVNGPGRQRGVVLTLALIAVIVAGFVYLAVQQQWAARSIAEVIGATDSSTLDVTVNHNKSGNGGPRVKVTRQSADSIVLSAEQDERGDCDDVGLTSIVTVELDAVLGQRAIRFQPEQQVGSVVCIIDGERADQRVRPEPSTFVDGSSLEAYPGGWWTSKRAPASTVSPTTTCCTLSDITGEPSRPTIPT